MRDVWFQTDSVTKKQLAVNNLVMPNVSLFKYVSAKTGFPVALPKTNL